jgi:hypothetical protein
MPGPTPEYHLDDAGNVRVDFVWGNMAMQPDHGRTDGTTTFGGGAGDYGWSSTSKHVSDTLQTGDYTNDYSVQGLFDINPAIKTDHIRASLGYSDFPSYIPNYAGDADPGIEQVVPDLLRKTQAQAIYDLGKLNFNLSMSYHNITINHITSTDTTVRVYCYDTNAAGGGSAQAYLVGLRAGDKVSVDTGAYYFADLVTITAVNEDGENSWIEFVTETAINYDDSASGNIYAGPDLVNVITVMRSWNQPGAILNENTNIYVRGLSD